MAVMMFLSSSEPYQCFLHLFSSPKEEDNENTDGFS